MRNNIVNASRQIENDGWQLNVNVESGSYLDQKNIFGVSSRSTNDFDNFDCPELPVHQNYISLYSKNNEKKLSKDIRQSDTYFHIWDIIGLLISLLCAVYNCNMKSHWIVPYHALI